MINIKNQKEILSKLKIKKLTAMQEEAILSIHSHPDVVIISPTGSGKTLAFLLPIISELDISCKEIQTVIVVPTRELAIQIDQVTREMGTGFKINSVYGGITFSKDKMNLKHRPAILVGTPGRIAAHLRREVFPTDKISFLVLDEFDKSLEIGFKDEMKEIISLLPNIKKRILTSATHNVEIPKFVGVVKPIYIKYTNEETSKLEIKTIVSHSKDKLDVLVRTLNHLGNQPGIIFCNFKDSIQRISDFLKKNNINHGCFYGNMEQKDRERALIKFRNGTHQLLIATDLASRGLDIPQIKFIIHYHLPNRAHEFLHRNGRTARMLSDGTAYVLKWEKEELPDFVQSSDIEKIKLANTPSPSRWITLFISGGREDKISKGDIAGLFLKQGQLAIDELGVIELKHDCAFVAVHKSKADQLIPLVNNSKLKKKKVRVTII